MRLIVAGVGRLKEGAEKALFNRYWERLEGVGRNVGLAPVKFHEITEGKAAKVNDRMADEAARLLKGAGDVDYKIVLDEHGKSMTSRAFASLLRARVDDGTKATCLYLGGPDGHDHALLDAAHLKLSLGAMTLPHGLARVVIAEQLYRAAAILSGHPYHRE